MHCLILDLIRLVYMCFWYNIHCVHSIPCHEDDDTEHFPALLSGCFRFIGRRASCAVLSIISFGHNSDDCIKCVSIQVKSNNCIPLEKMKEHHSWLVHASEFTYPSEMPAIISINFICTWLDGI